MTLNVSNCATINHHLIRDNISSINSNGNCVNLYKTEDCVGEYSVIMPGSPIHYDLSAWTDFNNNVGSIGPCFSRCDHRAVEKVMNNQTYLVTVYDDRGFEGM